MPGDPTAMRAALPRRTAQLACLDARIDSLQEWADTLEQASVALALASSGR